MMKRNKQCALAIAIGLTFGSAEAQTPDSVKTRIGTLTFKQG